MTNNQGASNGLEDIIKCIKEINIILFLSFGDLYARYKNSILGPLWISLGTGIFIFGLALLWGELFNKDRASFVPSMTVGLIMWHFISACLYESTMIYINKSFLIKNIKLPLFMFPLQVVIKQLINFFHNFLIFIIVFIIFDLKFNLYMLYFFPLMILFILNMLWITLFLSILGARFRDFSFVISSILPLLFFMSPVLYSPKDINFLKPVLWINPFSHLIEIVKAPLIGNNVELFSVLFSVLFMIFGWLFTIFLFNRIRNKIVFWV